MDLLAKPAEYFSGDRPEMLRYVPGDARRILEIGCGEGNFGAHLKQRNAAEVWGVEFDDAQAQLARQKLDRVFSGDIAMFLNELPANYFEAIVCNDVLEHLIDPYTVLAELRSKLAPSGRLISSLPNIRFFRTFFDFVFHKNWDYTDNGIMDKTHYRFFTVKSIRKMYESQGYEIILHEGINATRSIRPHIFNFLCLGQFSDIQYRQYATVVRAKLTP